ncbi:MAG: hypothetical protein P4L41_01765 [Flavipsychrobacter sp.]|nr:hypothetical protein [Flavipsychrobacter sp.]
MTTELVTDTEIVDLPSAHISRQPTNLFVAVQETNSGLQADDIVQIGRMHIADEEIETTIRSVAQNLIHTIISEMAPMVVIHAIAEEVRMTAVTAIAAAAAAATMATTIIMTVAIANV